MSEEAVRIVRALRGAERALLDEHWQDDRGNIDASTPGAMHALAGVQDALRLLGEEPSVAVPVREGWVAADPPPGRAGLDLEAALAAAVLENPSEGNDGAASPLTIETWRMGQRMRTAPPAATRWAVLRGLEADPAGEGEGR